MKDRKTIAVVFAHTQRLLRHSTVLTRSGFRVVSPRTPEEIMDLLRNTPADALVLNSTLQEPLRSRLLSEVRVEFPSLPIIHVFQQGEPPVDPNADANIDITHPEHLAIELEKLINAPAVHRYL